MGGDYCTACGEQLVRCSVCTWLPGSNWYSVGCLQLQLGTTECVQHVIFEATLVGVGLGLGLVLVLGLGLRLGLGLGLGGP